ncbi:hypothetical protein [Chryseobacterium indoltheticum]|uniref:Uncharacterized protein n=1 Tax=Chryseobacterium indoltheticum TaxID=254 RepID=A0A381FAG8_9FLAO|nr:hypothetical protein [Chryseobacterium indoltheticum]AZA73561.1 hypothetical protein EG358_07245 [Chryseobacterium indoltheticum]SIR24323.1 hypothetical protein SAMN05421682_11594 [Chryseobacterium indoltheticum]SUX43507.1 Uncharacterised protein [Chryseobacterium indoltheticum]
MENIFYKVSADDGMGGERYLGYASGIKSDIIKYFEPYKPYKDATIYVNEMKVVFVTPEMAKHTDVLLSEKEQLEARLKEINNALK